ncbi:MAG: ribonuclease catalytic domain-containing protein [Thermaceae bacterium]
MPMAKLLVVYKGKPALAEEAGDRILLHLEGGPQKVRPKDVLVLYPFEGEASFLPSPASVEKEALEAAWELLRGETLSLREFAELVYGAYTPEAAYGAFLLAQEGGWFTWEGGRIRARTREEWEALLSRKKEQEARQKAFQESLEALRRGEPVADLLKEVEAVALGKRKESPVLKGLDLPETPEAAHALLLRLGVWRYENPHPARLGLIGFALSGREALPEPALPVRELPEERRKDLTHLPAFAIDDEESQDPDDAVYAIREGKGFRLYVHVADVAALVLPDSPMDQRARQLGANLYLPEGVLPMLPSPVTQGLGLGLAPVSPALTFELSVSEEGELLEMEVYPSWIKAVRLSYREALGVEALQDLAQLALLFREKRLQAGGVDLSFPEVKVRLEGGKVRIRPLPPYESRIWVREAMLLAGYAAAHFALENALPIPFATQEAPQGGPLEGMEGLAGMWAQRKRMKRTQLRARPAPHRGLGLPIYTQATSPLRRYTDLVAHQQIRALLRGEKPLSSEEVLLRVGEAEAALDALREAERKSREHWTLVYLLEEGYEGVGVLVEKRKGQGVFYLPELGLVSTVALDRDLPLNAEVHLRFLEADLPTLSARFVQVAG